jgi:hypothetical protein
VKSDVGTEREKYGRRPSITSAKLRILSVYMPAEFSPAHCQLVRVKNGLMAVLLALALVVMPATIVLAEEAANEGEIAALMAKGKIVELPEGEIEITKPLGSLKPWQKLALRGKGRDRTVLKLKNDLVDQKGNPLPLIELKGTRDKRFSAWDIRDLTIRGEGHTADCFWLTCCVQGSIENVEIRHFRGSAIVGRQWWDSYLRNVHFTMSGDPERKSPVVWLLSMDTEDRFTNSNNLTFVGCRWERMFHTALQMDHNTTKVHVDDCKFHGDLPTPSICDHVRLTGAYSNTFSTTNFTNCGRSALVLTHSDGNVILGNTIGGCKTGPGVVLKGCKGTQLHANSFPAGWESGNKGGNVVESD